MQLAKCGLLPYFEGRIFSGHEMPRSKPAPDVYLAAMAPLGVVPGRCAVIEDTVTGVTAGVAAGATVFGYSPPEAGHDAPGRPARGGRHGHLHRHGGASRTAGAEAALVGLFLQRAARPQTHNGRSPHTPLGQKNMYQRNRGRARSCWAPHEDQILTEWLQEAGAASSRITEAGRRGHARRGGGPAARAARGPAGRRRRRTASRRPPWAPLRETLEVAVALARGAGPVGRRHQRVRAGLQAAAVQGHPARARRATPGARWRSCGPSRRWSTAWRSGRSPPTSRRARTSSSASSRTCWSCPRRSSSCGRACWRCR